MVSLSDFNFSVKWAGPNTPCLKFVKGGSDERVVLTKKDLFLIYKEIGEFMNFYADDFSGENINHVLTDYVDQTDD